MKKKILFLLPNLGGGGAERVMTTLLNYIDRDRFDLHLALISNEGVNAAFVPDDVTVHDLKAGRVRRSLVPLVSLIRRERPDAIMATLGYLNLFLLMIRLLLPRSTRIIVREGNSVSVYIEAMKNPVIWKTLYKRLYPRADKIVCQSDDMAQDLYLNFNIPREKLVRIYNPVDRQRIKSSVGSIDPFGNMGSGPHLVAAGRLTPQKGFDRLIEKIPVWKGKYPGLTLWILGEGELKEELKDLSKRLGVQDSVNFAGYQKNPYPWFAHADLFILSSRYEGLPNAMLEAIACGAPVMAVQGAGGTKEALKLCGLEGSYLDDLPEELVLPAKKGRLSEEFFAENISARYMELFN